MSKKAQNEILESNNRIPNKSHTKRNNSKEKNKNNQNNIYNSQIQTNIIYQKPSIKASESQRNNIITNDNNSNSNYIDDQDFDDNEHIHNLIKENKIKEIRNNVKENEIKIEKINKTMAEFLNNKKDDLNNTRTWVSQMNEIEKIQQENLALKADSIIYREDIIHLSEINKKLCEELEISKRKIFNLISKGEEAMQVLTNKNYEITQLTETISNLQLSNSPDVINNIKDNRAKDQLIYELQFELNNLNNDKIKNETELRILEEQYNSYLAENNSAMKEDEIYKNKINNNIMGLNNKIKNLEKQLEELSVRNNELKINNQKCNKNIEILNREKNDFEEKYEKKKQEYDELETEFKKLENKYSQLLYDTQKQNFIKEKMKNEEKKEQKRKKKNSSKQLIVNDLYNKIQMLKEKMKTGKEVEDK
jgi:hypothetical protein